MWSEYEFKVMSYQELRVGEREGKSILRLRYFKYFISNFDLNGQLILDDPTQVLQDLLIKYLAVLSDIGNWAANHNRDVGTTHAFKF